MVGYETLNKIELYEQCGGGVSISKFWSGFQRKLEYNFRLEKHITIIKNLGV